MRYLKWIKTADEDPPKYCSLLMWSKDEDCRKRESVFDSGVFYERYGWDEFKQKYPKDKGIYSHWMIIPRFFEDAKYNPEIHSFGESPIEGSEIIVVNYYGYGSSLRFKKYEKYMDCTKIFKHPSAGGIVYWMYHPKPPLYVVPW